MDSLAETPPVAWLPFTPSGVAAFARARLFWLGLVQFVVALIAACSVGWALHTCWYPVISAAVEHLPEKGMLRRGRLECSGDPVQSLAENHWLSLAIDLQHTGRAHSPSHLQLEFGQTDLRIYSVFGLAELPYPRSAAVPFNYSELKPWWGAWAPMLLALSTLSTAFALFLSWAMLATLYCVVAWLVGFYLNRDLTLLGSWRLAGAALMPGALVMAGAVIAYGLGKLDLVHLLGAWFFHLLLGWVYLVFGASAAPKIPDVVSPGINPFKGSEAVEAKPTAAIAEKPASDGIRTGGD